MITKIGVVGVGHLGQHHARIFSAIEAVQLIGVYDANRERCEEIAARFNCKAFSSYPQMLDEIDAVDISATTTAHYELAKEALLKNVHVFVEKPLTSELWQGKELVALAKERNLKLQVGHIERFNPVILKTEQEIKNPLFIESHRLAPFTSRGSDVPVVLDLMIHDIDLILSFVKSNLSAVHASGVSIFTSSLDIANARLEFENGAVANVTSSRVSIKRERKIRFFQPDAYLSLDFQEKKVQILRKSSNIMQFLPQILAGKGDLDPKNLVDITEIDTSDLQKDALTYELEAFVASIKEDKAPIVDGEAGLRALEIAYQIIENIKKVKI